MNIRSHVLPALLAATAALLGGCHIEDGSGHLGEQTRHVSSFDRVAIDGDFDQVWIETCDDCPTVATVRGDDNLIGDVVTSTRGSTLTIETDGWLIPQLPLEVIVQGPPTIRVEVEGSANVIVDGVAEERYDATVHGSGQVTINGQTAHFEAWVDGSGAVRAFDLLARDADVTVEGSGRIEVCAFGRLDAEVDGSGAIRFDCTPKSLGRHVSGSGTIRGR